jgi:hypothetical protein
MLVSVTYLLGVTYRYDQVLRFMSCLVNNLLKSYYPHSQQVKSIASTAVNARARIITAFKILLSLKF